MSNRYTRLSADQAVALINNGDTIATSGFTAAGTPKACGRALAERAKAEHAAGRPFKVRLLTGASTGPSVDQALAEADALSFRFPYQSNAAIRAKINTGEIPFFDLHLSHSPQYVEYGFLGEVDVAIVEVTEVTDDGKVYLTTAGGASPTYLALAKKVIFELNSYHNPRLREMHDVYTVAKPPYRKEIPIYHPLNKVGKPYTQVDPAKVIGIVETNEPDECAKMAPYGDVHHAIGENVVAFLVGEIKAGRIPAEFLPIQSGVGNVANAVLASMGSDPRIPAFHMFTEVFQDACLDLMDEGRLLGASTCSLTLGTESLQRIYENFDRYAKKIVIRPQAVSNNPGLVRRLGVISMNTAIEADIYGNINSTHVGGTMMMNGIGGSGDFTRNAYISIFTAPSTAKDGKISAIVPMVSHCDHNEHSVQVMVTEHGFADLRGVPPGDRPELIIEKCAHPDYRPLLHDYIRSTKGKGHIHHDLAHAFDFHLRYQKTGSMMPAETANRES
ncbi:succinate CoA transferase [bacterium]|nr:succinate CoA transferase [bacterium]